MSLAMELFLIDAIGPFFRGCGRMRVNWSKIPFMDLLDASPDDWAAIGEELREFARQVSAQGYNAVTLDDLAHLAPHPLHEPEVADRIDFLRGKFTGFFDMLHGKDLIFRTWTVGAHRIGDLIWHRGTLEKTLEGLDSPNLIVSMKHGEGDFFRYLPLNRAFAALELLDHADTVIRELLYIRDFARQKLFFRRVRIPPLLHVYWDSLFINHGVRKVMRIFC